MNKQKHQCQEIQHGNNPQSPAFAFCTDQSTLRSPLAPLQRQVFPPDVPGGQHPVSLVDFSTTSSYHVYILYIWTRLFPNWYLSQPPQQKMIPNRPEEQNSRFIRKLIAHVGILMQNSHVFLFSQNSNFKLSEFTSKGFLHYQLESKQQTSSCPRPSLCNIFGSEKSRKTSLPTWILHLFGWRPRLFVFGKHEKLSRNHTKSYHNDDSRGCDDS